MSYHSFGKVLYTTITSNDPPYVWNYSCDELESKLNTTLTSKTLEKVFVGLDGYLEGSKRGKILRFLLHGRNGLNGFQREYYP